MPESVELTHAQLVQYAARWLHSTRGCNLVATERTAYHALENPDAIGWKPDGTSIMVEVKTSVMDFQRDRLKRSEQLGLRMGTERWFLTPQGLLAGQVLPKGWGWLELKGGQVRRARQAARRRTFSQMQAELPLLVAIARRAAFGEGHKGIVCLDDPMIGELTPERKLAMIAWLEHGKLRAAE